MVTIPKPEFPRPELERAQWLNLNGTWDSRLFPKGEEAAFLTQRGEYDASITVPFSWADALSGVGVDVPGTGWYARRARFDVEGARLFVLRRGGLRVRSLRQGRVGRRPSRRIHALLLRCHINQIGIQKPWQGFSAGVFVQKEMSGSPAIPAKLPATSLPRLRPNRLSEGVIDVALK